MAAATASVGFVSSSSRFPYTYNGGFDCKATAFQRRRISFLSSHANTCEILVTRSMADSRQLRGHPNSSLRAGAVVMTGIAMNLVFVGAEVAPWSKTGELGDVLGGLPPTLAAYGHRVMTVAPRYDQYKDEWDTEVQVELLVGNRIETVRFFHCYRRGVDHVFVDHPMFLEKVSGQTRGKIYGPTTETDYEDNQFRFSILCQAALEAPRVLDLNKNKHYSEMHTYGSFGEEVVFIANDWHTAVLPCYLKSMYQPYGIYKNAKVAFCIHNIGHQGRFAFQSFELLNLPETYRSSFDFVDGSDEPVKGRKINWMKAGIIESDKVLTVSPHHAQELVRRMEAGVELDGVLRMKTICGIVNGMDTDEWNPATDKHITANYNAKAVLEAKVANKEALQAEFQVLEAKVANKEALQAEIGLCVDKSIPLIAFIGRLEEQKGADILAAAIPAFISENVQVIVLGAGKKQLEDELVLLEKAFPDKFRAYLKFDAPLAHAIMAGADMLVIPSRFEPCGLVQLQGMRYGTPSVCASTGGLVDTVEEGFSGFHMGPLSLKCNPVDEVDVQKVAETVKRALKVYGTPAFMEMIQNCMCQELSWMRPAKKWERFLLSMGAPTGEGMTRK